MSTITTTAQTTVNTTTSNTINISTTSITESMTADTSTTTESVESKPTVVTTVRRYDRILSKKTIKNAYILSTKYPTNDLNNHCVVRTLSEQENALLTNLFNAPNVTFRGEQDVWVKYIPSRPNEYAMAIDFTDDTCMILAIHFDIINDSPYWIATTMTNDKYDQETDYKELEFTRWIASHKLGEFLYDIVFNYNP